MNVIEQISPYQPSKAELPTITTRRLAVIARYQWMFLLEHNDQYNVTSFINTTLSKDSNDHFDHQQLLDKASQLLQARTWYHNIRFDSYLQQSYSRTFHKPDKDYNECGLYDWTALIVDLIDQDIWITDPTQSRTILRKTKEELDTLFAQDQDHGSSKLLWQLYNIQHHH
jgi:hypothetical protein